MTVNTNTIADEAGTGGPDFVGMPTVAGDPVVESGSNSDGEWTRWADGTQQCHSLILLTQYDVERLRYTWSYPLAFITTPTFSLTFGPTNESGFNLKSTEFSIPRVDSNADTQSAGLNVYRAEGAADLTSGSDAMCSVSAKGRWK